MELESWFEELSSGEVLIRGSRVDVATVAEAYRSGASAEDIACAYPSLELGQVYAAILYYLTHRKTFDRTDPSSGVILPPPPPVALRIRGLLATRRGQGATAGE